MARVALDTRTHNSLHLYIAELDETYDKSDRVARWYIASKAYEAVYGYVSDSVYEFSYMQTIAASVSRGGDAYFENLESGTSYSAQCYVDYYENGVLQTVALSFYEVTTEDAPLVSDEPAVSAVSISVTDAEQNQVRITVSFSGLGTLAGKTCLLRVYAKEYYPDTETVYRSVGSAAVKITEATHTADLTVVRVNYGCWYVLYAEAAVTGLTAQSDTVTFPALLKPVRPANWDWYAENTDYYTATSEQIEAARRAITYKMPVKNFSRYVWQSMIGKTMAFLEYQGLLYKTIGTDVYGTEDTCTLYEALQNAMWLKTEIETDGCVLKAEKFNILNACINRLCETVGTAGTEITDKATGEAVFGDYFFRLTDALNRIP